MPFDQGRHNGLQRDAVQWIAGMGGRGWLSHEVTAKTGQTLQLDSLLGVRSPVRSPLATNFPWLATDEAQQIS